MRRETDGLIQVGFCLPCLNFDRFHQPRLFTVGARRTEVEPAEFGLATNDRKRGGWVEFGIAQSRKENQLTEPGELRLLGGDCGLRTTRNYLLWQGLFQSSPTYAPTRWFHSRTSIRPSHGGLRRLPCAIARRYIDNQ